jgi:hypothetical protein
VGLADAKTRFSDVLYAQARLRSAIASGSELHPRAANRKRKTAKRQKNQRQEIGAARQSQSQSQNSELRTPNTRHPEHGTRIRSQARGAEGKKKKKSDVPTYLLFLRFFEIFRSDFRKCFMVFLGSSCRETAKNAIKKIDGKRREEKSVFSQHGLPPKSF